MLRDLLFRLRALFRRNAVETELEDELGFHFEHQVEKLRKAGLTHDEAVRQARLIVGGVSQTSEECRDARGVRVAEILIQDARYAVRMLRRNIGFTILAVVILALGMGANAAVFSVLYQVMLRPLPFKDPDRLVVISESNFATKVSRTGAPYAHYLAWKDRGAVFDETAAYWNVSGDGLVVGGAPSAERVQFSIVSENFLSILGVHPALGRGFEPSEEQPGAAKVFLASDALWHRSFGGDRKALGKTFLLDGQVFTLIGVLPDGFHFPSRCDVWMPTGVLTHSQLADRVSHPFWVLARLRHGTSLRQSQAGVDTIQRQLAQTFPGTDANWRAEIGPLSNEFIGDMRGSMLMLSGAVVFILLMACASVINLLLARLLARQNEFAVRMALGAGRARLLSQHLMESLTIAAIGAGLALLVGMGVFRAVAILSSGTMERLDEVHSSGPLLMFVAIVALLTTIFVGSVPAFQFSKMNVSASLRHDNRSGLANVDTQRLRSALVVSEVALALVLLCGAGLMLKNFLRLQQVDPGFDSKDLVTMKIALPEALYPKLAQRTELIGRLLEKIRPLPGVQTAAVASTLPLSGESNWETIRVVGNEAADWAHEPSVEERSVSADYFRTMRIPYLQGSGFTDGNPDQHSRAVVVNEALARKFWPGMNPIGRSLLTIDEQQRPRRVIGVVGNIKHFGLDTEGEPEMYLPYAWWSSVAIVARTNSDPARTIAALLSEIRALDKNVAVYQIAKMEELLGRSVARQRMDLFLLAAFASLALILATAGLYGVLALMVSRRRHEIGVRMALGAQPTEIMRLVVWHGTKLALLGLVIGTLLSFALARVMTGLLFKMSATDPMVFFAVIVLLLAVSVLASWIPAQRAMSVDPMDALRSE